MGRLSLALRLVIGDVRRHRVQALMLVTMVALTSTTLTLALALRQPNTEQFTQTRQATGGPDIVAELASTPGGGRPAPAQLTPLRAVPGVRATAGPYPLAFVRLQSSHGAASVQAEGRDGSRGRVDHPLITDGRWVTPGRLVMEHGLAAALGVHVGDAVELGRHRFRVGGIADTTAWPLYPARTPGLVWVTRRDAAQLASAQQPLAYVLAMNLRTSGAALDSLGAPAWATFMQLTARNNEQSLVEPWPLIRDEDYKLIRLDHKVLLVGSLLLTLLSIASLAVLVGGRMAQQTRRVGLLKAVGATPAFLAGILLAENLALALVAALGGVLAGALLAPSFASPGQGLVGSAPALDPRAGAIALTVGVAALVAAAATLAPALQAVRLSTLRALNDSARTPRRRAWLIACSAWVPTGLLIGLRIAARRMRRTLLTGGGLLVAVAMVVAAISVQASIRGSAPVQGPAPLFSNHGIDHQVNHVLIVLSVVLVVLAAITSAFTASATVIDAQRSTALARALGATPRQVGSALVTAQLIAALPAACLGIPAGLLLYQAAGGHLSEAPPSLAVLLAVIPATLVVVAAVSAVPARIGASRPVAEILRAD